jgi:hypothetical protein
MIIIAPKTWLRKMGGAPEEGMIDEHGNVKNAGRPRIFNVASLCSNEAFVDGNATAVAGVQMII